MALTKRQQLTRLTVAETEFRLATTILVNSAANLERLLPADRLNEIANALQVVQRASSELRGEVVKLEREIDGR